MEKSVIERYKPLGYAFDTFLDNEFSGGKTSPPNKIFLDKKTNILYIDYLYLYEFLPDIKAENISSKKNLEDAFSGKEVEEALKWLSMIVNEKAIFDTWRNDRLEFQVKIMDYPNMKKISEVNSDLRETLISIKGSPILRGRDVDSCPITIAWMCNECGSEKLQIVMNREKEPKKYKGVCNTLISDGKDSSSDFRCPSRNFKKIEVRDFLNVFNFQVEALPDDTPNKLDPAILHCEVSDRLTQVYFDTLNLSSSYRFTGIVKMRDVSTATQSRYIAYLDVMHMEEIEAKKFEIQMSQEERQKIIEFLPQSSAIDTLTENFGKGVVGFAREKKAFLLIRLMLERFNRMPKADPKMYVLHLLIVGNYARGKSELAEHFQMICDNPYHIIGSSTSGVGLSATSIKDEITGIYGVQAGVLARASGENLFVEEYDKSQNKQDLGVLNQAMSSFSYTVTKAGVNRTFKSATSIVMIANPEKKNFDETISLIPQINIAGDLLSRFCVISCVLSSKDVQEDLEINKILIKKMGKEVRQKDIEYANYIKKCIKIASENEPKMDVPEVHEYINNFTRQIHILQNQTFGSDQEFYKSINTRNIQSMLLFIKAVAMFHLHPIPTKEDMDEAYKLLVMFWKEFIERPELMNPMEIQSGVTLRQIEETIKQRIEDSKWSNLGVDSKKMDTKKGKRERMIDKIADMCKTSPEKICDESELKKWSDEVLKINDREFDELIQNLKFNSIIFSPRAGFLKTL